MRAGAKALSLLAAPLNAGVIRALAEGPKPLADLRRAVGVPPESTLRGCLNALQDLRVIDRHRQNDFPGAVDLELTTSGRELWQVANVVQRWLSGTPGAPIGLGTPAAKTSLKALVEGWNTLMIRAIAARPLSLTELNRLITGISYPSLERRLANLRVIGLLQRVENRQRGGTPYRASSHLQDAVAPIAAAMRWERAAAAKSTALITRLDMEALLLLAVPRVQLSANLGGTVRLAVEFPAADGIKLAGVRAVVKDGQVDRCSADLRGPADAWALGYPVNWLDVFLDGYTGTLEVHGELGLAEVLFERLHGSLVALTPR